MPFASAKQQRWAHAEAARGNESVARFAEHGDAYMREAKKKNAKHGPFSRHRDVGKSVLTAAGRAKIKPKNFVYPGSKSYPIQDRAHARNALARAAQSQTKGSYETVARAVHAKYPEIGKQLRYGQGQGTTGRRLVLDDVSKIDIDRALELSHSLRRKGKMAESRRAFQVGASAGRRIEGTQQRHLQARTLGDMEASERQGVGRAGRRRGVTWEDTNREIFARSDTGRAGYPNPFGKRMYEPEERRQRRIGMAQAVLLGAGAAGVGFGARGIRASTKAAHALKEGGAAAKTVEGKKLVSAHQEAASHAIPHRAIVARGRHLGYLGGGTVALGGAAGLRQYAESYRGRAYG